MNNCSTYSCSHSLWLLGITVGCTYLFFCKSLSECEYTFGITITVLKISQNNDNRGRHFEFYSHTGIGDWFQCFPVYPGLKLSSGSGSGFRIPDSGFRILAFHTLPCDTLCWDSVEPCDSCDTLWCLVIPCDSLWYVLYLVTPRVLKPCTDTKIRKPNLCHLIW